jgi:RHS repeat-associated protein
MKKGFNSNLKFFSICLLLLISTQKICAQPRTVPAAYASTVKVNFVRTWDATAPEQDPNILMTRPLKDVNQATQYLDGLGRPLQTVIKQGSMVTGFSATDMVSPVEYDQLGREQFKYLPFAANNTGGNSSISDGNFKLNPFQQQSTYMTTQYGSQNETFYYSKTNFEPSPLSRVTDAYAPGNSWVGSEANTDPQQRRNTQIKYSINTVTDAVRIWTVTNSSTTGEFGTYATSTTYPQGELFKTISTDEHKKQVIEFKDKEGKVILKKVQLTATPDDGTGSGYTGWLSTYYVYDDLNNLRCVIQPEGVKAILSSWTLSSALLSEQCFRYEYDQRNRMIMKKVPGAGEVYMIYDNRDRLVMTQDANMRQGTSKWMVTKYDDLNRPIETGLWTNSTSFAMHLSSAYVSSNYPTTTTGYELLTLTHYDDYNNLPSGLSATYLSTWNSNFSATNNTQWPYPQMPTQSNIVKGLPTWTQVKILGTSNTYLNSVTIYDDKGRPIQAQSTNITGGTDVATTQYSWAGQPLIIVQKQEKQGTNAQTHTVITKIQYDDLGRVLNIKKTVNSLINNVAVNKAEQLIVQNEYNQLGQLKKKTLGSNNLETLNYDYNIRGWILGMNRDYAKDANSTNYFGFDLGYDKANNNIIGNQAYTNPQYNGNIEGMVWKSRGDGEKRKYDFSYDATNRLMKADFGQYSGSVFDQSALVNFDVKMGDGDPTHNNAYDANGNILQMQQWGLLINQSNQIDNLTYTYQTGSNKLKQVLDGYNDNTSKLGDFKYDPATKTSTDYSYDVNGNLVTDQNKKILSIQYNHLNLPQVISVQAPSSWPNGSRTITYTYDAAGNKLKKQVYEVMGPGVNRTITTTYINGFVYDTKITNQGGSPEPDDHIDVLQFISQEEGRIRFKPVVLRADGTVLTAANFVYDYMLKDHLGNVRMVLTEEQQQDIYPAATLEPSLVSIENAYYTISQGNIVPNSTANNLRDPNHQVQTYPNNNGILNNNPNCSGSLCTSDISQQLYRLNGGDAVKTGLGITLKVMAGDKLDIFGKSYYFTDNQGGTAANSSLPIIDILSGLLGSPGAGSSTNIHGSVTPAQINTSTGTNGIISMLNNQQSQSSANQLVPRAFINYLFFDEQFKCVGSGFSQVGSNSVVKDHYASNNVFHGIEVPKNGFVYIYCSNQSPVDVFFDNLQVVHTRGPILEETHYYPFGLTMAGISTKAAGSMKNNFKYNDKELENQEFSDGSGLELYDFGARFLDQQLGIWHTVDPLADNDRRWSPYKYACDNPLRFLDPDGMKDEDIITIKKDGQINRVATDDPFDIIKNEDGTQTMRVEHVKITKQDPKGKSQILENPDSPITDGTVGSLGCPPPTTQSSFTILDNDVAAKVYEFVADNTNVEIMLQSYSFSDGSTGNTISNVHRCDQSRGIEVIGTLKKEVHSHPANGIYFTAPSGFTADDKLGPDGLPRYHPSHCDGEDRCVSMKAGASYYVYSKWAKNTYGGGYVKYTNRTATYAKTRP